MEDIFLHPHLMQVHHLLVLVCYMETRTPLQVLVFRPLVNFHLICLRSLPFHYSVGASHLLLFKLLLRLEPSKQITTYHRLLMPCPSNGTHFKTVLLHHIPSLGETPTFLLDPWGSYFLAPHSSIPNSGQAKTSIYGKFELSMFIETDEQSCVT